MGDNLPGDFADRRRPWPDADCARGGDALQTLVRDRDRALPAVRALHHPRADACRRGDLKAGRPGAPLVCLALCCRTGMPDPEGKGAWWVGWVETGRSFP